MLRIESIKIWEEHQDYNCLDYDSISLNDINLIIGDNASGKSQFFSRLKHLAAFHWGNTLKLSVTFHADIVFQDDEENGEKINYRLKIEPSGLIEEMIKSDSKNYLIHDDRDKTLKLLNEKTNREEISRLFNRKDSITKQIGDNQDSFPTISKIGNFLGSILFVDADKFNPYNVRSGPEQIIPSYQMENISSVVANWQTQHPGLWKHLLKEYNKIFPKVKEFSKAQWQNPNNGTVSDILTIKEEKLKSPIWATGMSSGMIRILSLLALPMCRQLPKGTMGSNFCPSMVVVDEIDNGLDYQRIGDIIEFLEAEASFFQILFSSHSPLILNFVSPEKWHIFRRSGHKVKITRPNNVEETKQLIDAKVTESWRIYRDFIAHNPLYSAK